MRFSLLTATNGGSTTDLRSRTGIRSAAVLDDVPDQGDVPGSVRVPLTLIRRFSGAGLSVPELRDERDRAILARVVAAAPALGSEDGWSARFGRELNATDDRRHFGSSGLPVLEGKLIDPFVARVAEATQFVDGAVAARLLSRRARIDAPRLGYREVAASTNRLTLIAAIIPARVVTTHTIFCMREPDDEEMHWFLCGVFNSYVANYLVRLRGGTHVPAAVIHQLPVPRPDRSSAALASIAALARDAVAQPSSDTVRAQLQARVTRAYGLDEDDLIHVLSTFPLVPAMEREAALRAFRAMGDGL
jgi:hypothetical protein